MTICQYFLEGRCRFGQNCRNEHSYSSEGGRSSRATTFDSQQLRNIMRTKFSREVVGEVILVEKGGQWPLSCFAPIKEGPNIPGFEDYSPEEIRWKMYEARTKGNLDQCINEVKQLYNEAEKRRNALKQPTVENMNLISNIVKMKEQSSQSKLFGSPFAGGNQGSSIFGGSNSQTTPTQNLFGGSTMQQSFGNIFGGQQPSSGNTGSIFGGSPPTYGNQNIFGNSGVTESQNIFSSSQTSTQSLFGGGTQNVFSNPTGNSTNFGTPPAGGSVFSGQVTSSAPIFAAQSMMYQPQSADNSNQTNIFGGVTSASSGGATGLFSSQTPTKSNTSFTFDTPKTSHFGTPAQPSFGTNLFAPSSQPTIDYSVYSKSEDLTQEELQEFAAPTFTFGKIPMKPPPLESCK